MHTSTSQRNADFCIWEQLLSEMEHPTDGYIVIVGGRWEGSYFGFSGVYVCVWVCVRGCLIGCVPHYLDLSVVIKGFYSLWIFELEQAFEIISSSDMYWRKRGKIEDTLLLRAKTRALPLVHTTQKSCILFTWVLGFSTDTKAQEKGTLQQLQFHTLKSTRVLFSWMPYDGVAL